MCQPFFVGLRLEFVLPARHYYFPESVDNASVQRNTWLNPRILTGARYWGKLLQQLGCHGVCSSHPNRAHNQEGDRYDASSDKEGVYVNEISEGGTNHLTTPLLYRQTASSSKAIISLAIRLYYVSAERERHQHRPVKIKHAGLIHTPRQVV